MIGRTISHYRVLEKLGQGGMGEVYRARDERLGRDVAIKILLQNKDRSRASVERFIREAKAASSLNHPNIVTIHEAGQIDDGHFIVMELVPGQTLRKLLGEPSDLKTVIEIGKQIARALAAAHEQPIVHRDIKPENIMVRDDGYVKVLDFGLARFPYPAGAPETATTMLTADGGIVGTLRYMSPEQAQGGPLSPATDVFSFGMVLYELATGRHPFFEESPLGTIGAILSQEALPPSRLNPELPAELDALILRMLDKRPLDRPLSKDIVEVLESLLIWPGTRPSPIAPAATPLTVGRRREMEQLRAGFTAADSGKPAMLCLTGEAGIGKTTVVENFFQQIRSLDTPSYVARGRASEQLASTEAYLCVLEALDYLRRSDRTGTVGRTMRLVAPTWYTRIGRSDSSESSSGMALMAGSPERLKMEFVTLLTELSTRQPLVLFLDDLHWADASSVELLNYLAQRLEGARLLVLVTARAEELYRSRHPFLQVKQDLQARGVCRELTIDFLTGADVGHYLDLRYPGHRFGAAVGEAIHSRTEGNALFMVDVLRDLEDKHILNKESGTWMLTIPVGELEKVLPESLRAALERKMEALNETGRRLLAAASVQGYQFDSAILARAIQREAADVEDDLEAMDRVHGLIRRVGEGELPDRTLTMRCRFVHGLYQNIIHSSLTPNRRVGLSAAVAQALLDAYKGDSGRIAAQLALLFEAARDFGKAVQFFNAAALHAAGVFAYQETLLLARRGLALLRDLPDGPEKFKAELSLTATLAVPLSALRGWADPELEEVSNRALQLCQMAPESPFIFPALKALSSFYTVRADYATTVQITEQMMTLATKLQDSGLLVQAHLQKGVVEFLSGRNVEAMEDMETVCRLFDPKTHASHAMLYLYHPKVSALYYMHRLAWILGYPDKALHLTRESVELSKQTRHPFTMAFAQFGAVSQYWARRDVEATKREVETFQQFVTEHGFAYWAPWAVSLSGWVKIQEGALDEGAAKMKEAIAMERRGGGKLQQLTNWVSLAEGYLAAGRYPEAMAALEEAPRLSETGFGSWEPERLRVWGEVLLATGRLDAAHAHFKQALQIARDFQAKIFELRAAVSLARWHKAKGEPQRGHTLLCDVYGWFTEGLNSPDLVAAKSLLDTL